MRSRLKLRAAVGFLLLSCGGDPTSSENKHSFFSFDVALESGSRARIFGDSTRWEYRANLNGGRPGLRDLAIELYTSPQSTSASLSAALFLHGFGDALTASVANPGSYPVDDPNAPASFNVEFLTDSWYGAGRQGTVQITAATAEEIRGTVDLEFDQMQGVNVIGQGHLTGSFAARHSNQPDWTP
jgi:hypothetical protein